MIPTFILGLWLLGLVAIAIAGGAIYLGREWYFDSWTYEPETRRSVFSPDFGWNEPTAMLAGAVALLLITLFGGSLLKAIRRLTGRKDQKQQGDPRKINATPNGHEDIRRPDGSEIHVEFYGSPDAQPLVMSHGWGLTSKEWNYAKADLAEHFRLIVWDAPGLGRSSQPENRDYSIENLARDLDAVLNLAGERPALLLGHSIGGMIILTFCRLFRGSLGTRVAGLILVQTTYTNPLRTRKGSGFYLAIQNPILKPMMWLTIALSPIVRLMSWLSYRNGTAHWSTKRSSFAGTESWEELDFATQFTPRACPAVLARGMLGMLRFDETETLTEIPVPTLIIAGNQDTTTLPAASERIRADIPNARLITLAPARHLGLIERRDEFASEVREFSNSVAARSSVPATGSPA